MGAVKNFKFDSPLEWETAHDPAELVEQIAGEVNKALDEFEERQADAMYDHFVASKYEEDPRLEDTFKHSLPYEE